MDLDCTSQIIVQKADLNGRQLRADFLPSLRPRCANHCQSKYSSSLSQGNFITSPPAQFMAQHQKGKFLIT